VLYHYHLLDQDIGAWPKHFGTMSANQLKEDVHDLVKTYDEAIYNDKLQSVRTNVKHNPKLSAYVEEKIHSKRHLFANHLIDTSASRAPR
jgi:hypothetical protein